MKYKYKISILSNATEWSYYCWKNYINMNPNIVYYRYSFPLPKVNKFIYKVLSCIYTPQGKYSSVLRPLARKVICHLFRLNRDERNILIMYDWNPLSADKLFIEKIRKNNPNVLIVYVFTNIVKYTGAKKWGILEELNSIYDVVYAFDKNDAERYNFEYLPLIYAKETQSETTHDLETDIFYVGKAKDRLDIIHEVYEHAVEEGLNCDFNVINVPENLKKYQYGINYNNVLPYHEVIKRIKKAKCLLDVIQGDSTGLTIKVAEAVVYNKKLITNNLNVLSELPSSSDKVLLYDGTQKLRDFISQNLGTYGLNEINYFSPSLFVERLVKKYNIKYDCQ